MDNPYLEVISYVERLHRQFLEVVKLELEGFGIRDINNIQAMMLFNIGEAQMTVGELILRGCYLGSNVSYKEDGRERISRAGALGARSALDSRSIDRKRDQIARQPHRDASTPCRDAVAGRCER